MGPIGNLVIMVGMAGIIGGIAAAVLHRPLDALFRDLCHTGAGARFWTLYLDLMLVFAPMLAASFLVRGAAYGQTLEMLLPSALFFALLGIVVALIVIGWNTWRTTLRIAAPLPAAPKPAAPKVAA